MPTKTINRHSKSWIFILSVFIYCTSLIACQSSNVDPDPWALKDTIIANIVTPTFPNKVYNIIDYGAIADGSSMSQSAFDDAIAACSQAGGGKVIVPAGKFLTGPIHLLDNVNLHLEDNSEILFSTNLDDFPIVKTSYEGTELMNFSPLIYAQNKTNIAITGTGTLNGQASNEHWWPWCGNTIYGWEEGAPKQHTSLVKLKEGMSEIGIPYDQRVFGKGEYLRPLFIEPYECKNVLIEGVKIINAPFWVIHPFKSTSVTVDGVRIESHGPNNDGCNPEYSKNVLIKNCSFNTGDDCIAIKAGRNEDGRRVNIKSENIVVQNCRMIDGHGGVVMGSELSAGIKNVFVEDCHMSSPNLDRAIRIKTNTKRGGSVENLYVRNITVGEVKEAFLKVNLHYGIYGNQSGEYMPSIKNIALENITVEDGGEYGILIHGYEEHPVDNITLTNVTVKKVKQPYSVKGATNIQFINTKINGKTVKQIEN